MQRRLAGFMSFITEEYEELVIHEVVLNKSNQENNQKTLDEFFRLHPKATLGVVFKMCIRDRLSPLVRLWNTDRKYCCWEKRIKGIRLWKSS